MIAFACLASFAFEEPVQIAWKPETQSITAYEVHVSGLYGAGNVDVRYTLVDRYLGRPSADHVAIEESLHTVSYRMGAQDLDSSQTGPRDTNWRLTRTVSGEATSYSDNRLMPDWPRDTVTGQPFFDFFYPDRLISKGEMWSHSSVRKGGAGEGGRARPLLADAGLRQVTFTYIGLEKIGRWNCNKVQAVLKVTPGPGGGMGATTTGGGTFWVSTLDGSIVKSDLTIGKEKRDMIVLHQTMKRIE